MNWSHALLVIALICGVAIAFTAIGGTFGDSKLSYKWARVLFIITVISGALAAGLWR